MSKKTTMVSKEDMKLIIQYKLEKTLDKFLKKIGLAAFKVKEFYVNKDHLWARAEVQMLTKSGYPILKIGMRTDNKGVSWSCGGIRHTSRIDDINKILQTL